MFNKPLSQIGYSDVETFCNTFTEGVRVEYKSEMIEKIPKVISSFANTLGGIVVIGVKVDAAQNKVVAIEGIDNIQGIEERIINSSLNGIYPSVIPEIKVVEIPGCKDKILIVIKVHESLEAPHAIQNSTRVYIRTGSINQPYELSEIDRIEYLLKRREKPARLKEELRQKACNRIERILDGSKPHNPYFYISILPVFPHQPLVSLDDLYMFCNTAPYGSIAHAYLNEPQRVTGGICKFHGNANDFYYREINHYGLVFTCDTLDKRESRWNVSDHEETKKLYIRFAHFVWGIGRALKLAEMFYNKFRYLGNLELKVDVENIADESLLYNEEGLPPHEEYRSIDSNDSSAVVIMAEDIESELPEIVVSLMRNILWVFNCPVPNSKDIVKSILVANGLITN